MQLALWLLVAAAVVAVLRVYLTVRRVSAQRKGDWDERLVKMLDGLSESAIVELNIPTGVPLLYELDDQLAARSSRYLGNAEAVQAASDAVGAQAEQRA